MFPAISSSPKKQVCFQEAFIHTGAAQTQISFTPISTGTGVS